MQFALSAMFVIACLPRPVFSEPGAAGEVERQLLWKTIEQSNQSLQAVMADPQGMAAAVRLLNHRCDNLRSLQRLRAEGMLQESAALSADKGIDFRGGYTVGDDSGNLDDESRAYLELNWNVLKEGYFGRQQQANALRHRARAVQINAMRVQHQDQGRCRDLNVSHVFATAESVLLGIKFSLMQPVHEIERRAYLKGWSFLDDLLESESDLLATRESIQRINTPALIAGEYDQLNLINPPVIDVNLAGMIEAIQADELSSQAHQAERQAAYHDAQLKDQKDRFRVFIRRNFVQDSNSSSTDGYEAGIRFVMPLSRKTGVNLEQDYAEIDARYDKEKWQRIARVRVAYIKVHEQLERTQKQHYRFLRANERLRRSLVGKSLQPETAQVVAAVLRSRSLIDAGLELLKAKAELYQRVNNMFVQAELEFQPEFIRLYDLPGTLHRARQGQRALYVWSTTFNATPNARLWQFIEAKGIKTIILSASQKIDRNKMQAFIKESSLKKVAIELMLGSRDWIFKEKQQRALIRSIATLEQTGKLHLDIEPHTLPGFKQHRRQYLDAYTQFIAELRSKMSDDARLSISVPLHWDLKDYLQLSGLVDEIYLMAYETSSINTLQRRLAPLINLLGTDKITIALRPQDFADEWQLEQVVSRLKEQFGVNRFAMHHAAGYMNMPVVP